jgi:hypothetical protein
MANLLGQNIGTNYKGILSLDSTINTPLDANLRAVTDGEGNASPLELSTTAVSVGTISGARLGIKGSGTTSGTTALLVQNSDGTNLLKVDDSGFGFYINNDEDGKVRLYADGQTGIISGGRNLKINSGGGNALNISGSGINGVIIGSGLTTLAANTALAVRGQGTTVSTTALLVQNSAGTQSFKVADSGSVQIGLTSGINWTFNSNILSSSQYAYIAGSNGSILTNGNFSGGVHGNGNGGKVCDNGISTAQVASSVLEVSSTTKGFLPPRMTTTQKNAIATPASGLIVYDETTNKLACYNGTTWNDLF